MKVIMLFLVMLGIAKPNSPEKLSKEERRFVKTVVKNTNEKLNTIIKREDSHIVLEFDSTICVLRPNGFIDEVWILDNEEWISLGNE